ncbi:hypothetical protein [Curvivirga aplysinae]|uniref:hypothetical protein n=1 Tax=Curvivirga aplysinae TaxID=2529852 RepID=UPI0012BC5D19|nr:hypothetical protein [Curvivirga aplysinae]MTI09547.1 hypothetical protein [Curvivirga aplysinae]
MHIQGLIIGLVIGGLDCLLFWMSGLPISGAMLVQALLFWMAVGWVIHVVNLKMNFLLKGILVAIFLNSPWMIEFVFIQAMQDMLIPMLVVAIILGVVAACCSRFLKREVQHAQ